ncbi:LysM peptidoglycan-binding domain-containing protein [Deinococcus sp.]|uniref:LysM peptidoglycan-binding domain-containing protein n=1 Tax=Deinococcus sp. TaxID=47478 RepID=UPI0025CD4F55|nr:LysM peptidoglycan-binding domain-containing protein [Deinococcus sp.]
MWPFGKSTADRVKEALNDQPRLKDLGLQVNESGGSVSVSGMVPTDQYSQLVSVIAQGINGVTSVDTSGLIAQQVSQEIQAPTPSLDVGSAEVSADSYSIDMTPVGQGQAVGSQAVGSMDDEIAQAVASSSIAKAVLHAIRSNGEISDGPIDVLQSGKTVILRGAVDNDHEVRLAEQVARAVPGVAGVDVSGLRVIPEARKMAKSRDTATGDATYTIEAGDTLSSVAQKYFGDAMRYKDIAHFNNISNPDHVEVGQVLRIPSS